MVNLSPSMTPGLLVYVWLLWALPAAPAAGAEAAPLKVVEVTERSFDGGPAARGDLLGGAGPQTAL